MTNKTLTITRIFNAPRELVWKAWTDPEMAKKWWGPKDFTSPSMTLDLKVGGKYLNCMRGKMSPESEVKDFWSTGVYKEIIPNQKLVMSDSFADENGNVVSASHYGIPGKYPEELEVTVTFEEQPDGKTKMTLIHSGFPTDQDIPAEQGWNQQFDKLDQLLNEDNQNGY